MKPLTLKTGLRVLDRGLEWGAGALLLTAAVGGFHHYGAGRPLYVNLSDGFEGMIHIGDITSEKRLNHPREVLTEGQPVRAKVLELDRQRRRIRLGLKQLEPTMADQFINEHKPGDTTPGRVIEVASGQARVVVVSPRSGGRRALALRR